MQTYHVHGQRNSWANYVWTERARPRSRHTAAALRLSATQPRVTDFRRDKNGRRVPVYRLTPRNDPITARHKKKISNCLFTYFGRHPSLHHGDQAVAIDRRTAVSHRALPLLRRRGCLVLARSGTPAVLLFLAGVSPALPPATLG